MCKIFKKYTNNTQYKPTLTRNIIKLYKSKVNKKARINNY